ncbi:hypothetical protein J4436_04405 [Candidatus Woesearchaeota archaeon]|nr:hypothetical protein [Candidatus Woesearchaeota archaeon]
MGEYILRLKYSLSQLKNIRLWIPDLLLVFITLLLTFLVIYINNLTSIIYATNPIETFKTEISSILQHTPSLIKFIITFVIGLLINLLTGISLSTIKYELIKETIDNKKINFNSLIKTSKGYIWPLFKLKFIIFLIYFIPLLILIYLLIINKFRFLAILLMVILLIIVKLFFLFRIPSLFYKTKNSIKVLKHAYEIFRKTYKKTIIILLLITFINIILVAILSASSVFEQYVASKFAFYSTTLLMFILRTIINLAFALLIDIFIFKNYKEITS